MTRAQLLTELRAVLNVAGTDITWYDSTLIGYLAEGQDKFCEETGFFRDKVNYTIALQTDTAVYAIPDRVIQVMDVWDGNRKLAKVVDDRVLSDDDWPVTYGDITQSGLPARWRTDNTTGSIEVSPIPTAEFNGRVLTLQVWRNSRYPLDRMSSTVTLAGTLHTGDIIAATVNGTVFSYTVEAGDGSLSAVATALAAVIDASSAFVSTASGQVISIAAAAPETSTATTVVVSGSGATVTASAADAYSANPELMSRFQRACLEWAAYKAFNHHDIEAQDPVKAADHLQAFGMYVSDGVHAFRRLHNQETRVGADPAYRT